MMLGFSSTLNTANLAYKLGISPIYSSNSHRYNCHRLSQTPLFVCIPSAFRAKFSLVKAMAGVESTTRSSSSGPGEKQALISLSNKKDLDLLANGLQELGFFIVSTGGTASTLEKAGIPVTKVEQITGFPEMLDGRVKTLHPKIHGGILARRDLKHHVEALNEHGIDDACIQ